MGTIERKDLRNTVVSLLKSLQDQINKSRHERGREIYLEFSSKDNEQMIAISAINILIFGNPVFMFECIIVTDDFEKKIPNSAMCSDQVINIIMEKAKEITLITMTSCSMSNITEQNTYFII